MKKAEPIHKTTKEVQKTSKQKPKTSKQKSKRSKRSKPSKLRLTIVVVLANMASFMMGASIAWCSPVIPKIKYNYTDNPVSESIDPHTQGWIFGLLSMGALSTAIFVGILIDSIGRKPIIMLSTLLYITSYVIMYRARHFNTILIGRFIMGLGAGLTMTCIPIYVGEISTKESRGSLGSLFMMFMTLGMLFVYCIGPFTTFREFQICGFCVGIVSFLGFFFIPESPVYLVRNNRRTDAINVLKNLRGQNARTVAREIADFGDKAGNSQVACRQIIQNRSKRRAYQIAMGLIIFQMSSGALVMIVNMQTIFIQAKSAVEPAYASIIVGFVQCTFSLLLQLLVDRMARRTLLTISAIGMSFIELSIGTYFFLQLEHDTSEFRWLPLAFLIFFQLFYRLGFGPLPFTMVGELFTADLKAFASTSVTFTCWGMGFFIGRFYPVIDTYYGAHYVFWFCGSCDALAILFVRFVVIETKGLSFTEIQNRLSAR